MISATLSSKYQLAIPKIIREELGLQVGRHTYRLPPSRPADDQQIIGVR
jgi:hypothetical protein